MNDFSAANQPQVQSTTGLGDALPTRPQRYRAFALAATVLACAALAAHFGLGQGPEIKPLVPMAATVWSLADLLTAFLLLAQFYVNGRLSFAVLAVAYALSGILTWAYLLVFPGLFVLRPLTAGELQLAVFFWMTWHCSFPALVMVSTLNDSALKRIISRRAILWATFLIVTVPLIAAVAVAALFFSEREALPRLIVSGHFQPLFRNVVLPVVIAVNGLGCLMLLSRRARMTMLQLWLCVAMFSACLDSALNLSGMRYSYAWDVGKLITVFTSSVVLIMILCEIVKLYGRLAQVARIDALTLLPNRRAFEEHLQLVFHNAQRLQTSMALLMVDIDFFKRYNDSYGHAAGDECLRAIGRELMKCATRPLDLVARYGGEEFVVVLPDTTLKGVLALAERIRCAVESLQVRHGSDDLGRVTLSIGIGYAPNAAKVAAPAIFEAADRGLYQAKDSGRNRVILGSAGLLETVLGSGASAIPAASVANKRGQSEAETEPHAA